MDIKPNVLPGISLLEPQIYQEERFSAAGFSAWLRERSDVYHLTNSCAASLFKWANVVRAFDLHPHEHQDKHQLPAAPTYFPDLTKRPSYSLRLPIWEHGFALALGEFPSPDPSGGQAGGVP